MVELLKIRLVNALRSLQPEVHPAYIALLTMLKTIRYIRQHPGKNRPEGSLGGTAKIPNPATDNALLFDAPPDILAIMSVVTSSNSNPPRWQRIGEELERLAAEPTKDQLRVAGALDISIPMFVPAPVAAAILQHKLSSVLFQKPGSPAAMPQALWDLEDQLGITEHAFLTTHSREEVSAWFNARYMTMTARGLRRLQPEAGDVVQVDSKPDERRVVSSIGEDGRVYFKGRPSGRAWPNHLTMVERMGSPEHAAASAAVDAAWRNAATYRSVGFDSLALLEPYLVDPRIPDPEALHALELLLESGEAQEAPFQKLIESYPALLASTVIGSWKTYVIPQKRLGAEYVPDFLVLGVNSVGPQWVAVEIEAARHRIVNKNATLSSPTRHAVEQIRDWREWLTENVAYAQMTLGLPGLTNRVPGLVIIGRDSPSMSRQASRAQLAEDSGIEIHSWDWLLRSAQQMVRNPLQASHYARNVLASHS